ncbi:M20 family metallopeptidase [Phytohabitans rumicis]|uniref:Glutamate carboxypeptidase n=1 Tax=Phytohabitans rumicis TaxID=1076125 RepID=A0A6V8LDT6_9ACTN|nr:M20 family metallopeptidase [Phytohabitans rumicis]GFJ92256.1 glutamate carboxypeptidase [Phytohabitans rumicis]
MIDRLGELVGCESPAGSMSHLAACADLLAGWGAAVLGAPPQRVVRDGLPHLLWSVPDQRVLLLGHFDTVWPAGTIRSWPFAVNGTVATGPGVCDMKAGIVQMFTALGLLASTSRVGVLLTCDEEVGSGTSRALIERQARRSGAVLVCEPSTPEGHLKVARKGGSVYRLTVHGRAAHAGVEPHRGVNATVEAAHQVLAVRALAAPSEGTSVTPTMIAAGTTTNTVPERATLTVDVRGWTRAELDRVDREIHCLTPLLPEAGLTVDGTVNRYPMTPDLALPLLDLARAAAKDIGLPPPEGAHAPGASDGNFTAALGVPTLDGLGAVGGGAHARDEYVDLSRLPERAALLAGLIERLLAEPRWPAVSPP